MNITEAEILQWIAQFVWPLIRISAMFIAMPIFSIQSVPARSRLILSLVITLFMMPLLPQLPQVELFSYSGIMVSIQQVIIGLVTGFILQMAFAAVVFAGQGVALSMGLGFASMIDPQNGQQVPVIAQLYVILTTLIFLSFNGHLLVIKMLLDSFTSLPIGLDGITRNDIWIISTWCSHIFAAGLLLSIPIIISLLLINICFGIAARAAPQLNIFSIGFPSSLFLGTLLIWLTLPDILDQFSDILIETYNLIENTLRL